MLRIPIGTILSQYVRHRPSYDSDETSKRPSSRALTLCVSVRVTLSRFFKSLLSYLTGACLMHPSLDEFRMTGVRRVDRGCHYFVNPLK